MADHERVSNANQARHILKKRRKRHRPPFSKLGKSTRNTGPNSTNGVRNFPATSRYDSPETEWYSGDGKR
ncbi:hypothetical protein PanWU01x14_271060 [Parasponia andersonii]|uniref:Uncharacterized protein n=1 Tax=Parasponia andersonii TaxID=3476 RepID=A0A2P5B4T1_PARAD|nr:hypothetical protein PanWU01x14_271060 [Parasponia andersonii]